MSDDWSKDLLKKSQRLHNLQNPRELLIEELKEISFSWGKNVKKRDMAQASSTVLHKKGEKNTFCTTKLKNLQESFAKYFSQFFKACFEAKFLQSRTLNSVP